MTEPHSDRALTEDERAELDRLRAEIVRPRAVLVVLAVVALILPTCLDPSYVLWTVLGLPAALFVLAVLVAPEPAPPPPLTRADALAVAR